MHRDQFLSTVVSNTSLCAQHYRLVLGIKDFPATAPGQFVQLICSDARARGDHETNWSGAAPPQFRDPDFRSPQAFLRRPFSLAGRRDVGGGVELELMYRVVGVGTSWLSGRKEGQQVAVLGPLGNSFILPPEDQRAILVGGGVGIPPMLYLARLLTGRKAIAFCGATTRDLLPLTVTADSPAPKGDQVGGLYNIAEFASYGIPAVVATDDGSYGFKGLVTAALETYLARWFGTEGGATVYTCGPEAMMKRVAQIAASHGMECQVSVERAMACGMGTCQSCCIKVRKPDPAQPPLAGQDWAWRLACTDGPVFRGADLLW